MSSSRQHSRWYFSPLNRMHRHDGVRLTGSMWVYQSSLNQIKCPHARCCPSWWGSEPAAETLSIIDDVMVMKMKARINKAGERQMEDQSWTQRSVDLNQSGPWNTNLNPERSSDLIHIDLRIIRPDPGLQWTWTGHNRAAEVLFGLLEMPEHF